MRSALVARRAEHSEELERLTAVSPAGAVSFGKRIGEGTTAAIDRIEKVGAAADLPRMLRDAERAIGKLDEGSYGICDSCGDAIARDRLQARPWSVLCVRCAARASR